MPRSVQVEKVSMAAAGATDQAAGVIGFVQATINGFVFDSLTIRRSLGGELRIGFPRHTDKHDRVHSIVRPEDDAMRREITRQILAALGLDGTAIGRGAAQGDPRAEAAP